MRLIFIVHVSTTLLWAVFAAPAHPLYHTATVDAAPAKTHLHPCTPPALLRTFFKPSVFPSASHTSAQEEATHAPDALELDQKQKKPGSSENNCVIV
ncbi:hypothetical protein C8R44DRAFT_755500 [Mycena epipterygia]|nr:hypothetical protein C8R44DRAFT_755500 [Mycena epipterygia]